MCVRLFLSTFVVLALALSGSVQADLLQNGGFEANAGAGNSADYWANTEEAGVESWAAHTGSWGMAFVTWRGDGTGDFYQDVSVVENTLCTYKIWVSRDAGTLTGAYYMKIKWYNGDTYISEDSQLLDITDTWM